MDKNNDGKLTVEEMQSAGKLGAKILEQREKWDKDKSGTIELEEYIEYSKERKAERERERLAREQGIQPEEEEKRAVVYRFGKMPKDLPEWFEKSDTDKDGQIGLYEWKQAGKSAREFETMDLNGDGFVTVEELLRHQKAKKDTDTTSAAGAAQGGVAPAGPMPGAAPPGAVIPGGGGPRMRPGMPGGGMPGMGGERPKGRFGKGSYGKMGKKQ